MKVKRALISVWEKKGIVEFAKGLSGLGIDLIASGGTARVLRDAGMKVKDVSDITGFGSMLSGRVKTLHPYIFGGILAKREEAHLKELAEYRIEPIDMVIVNLYPFEETVNSCADSEEIIEQIDIGGPSLIRASAKNHRFVAVVVNPERYPEILEILKKNDRELPEGLLYQLAKEAFLHTARYDSVISAWFEKEKVPERLSLSFEKALSLRYGENPHQEAGFYVKREPEFGILRGELSYNNILDADTAFKVSYGFAEPCCVIIKHNNPAGVAVSDSIKEAYKLSLECDPVSAFGGIIGVNRELDADSAEEMAKHFFEVIVAPSFSKEALSVLPEKIRLLVTPSKIEDVTFRSALGGLLLQTEDSEDYKELSVVTEKKPAEYEIESIRFGIKVAKFVKSNAVILVRGKRTVGIGAGQMSRVDSVRIAIAKARDNAKGSVLISDAFFPFADSIEEAKKAEVSCIAQPGGSVRDREVIEAADRAGISMVFTGIRHFRH
jgi:phosphoribosylaminoimidazolecarboxamide formyltransferase/IMP cyclohydrolase